MYFKPKNCSDSCNEGMIVMENFRVFPLYARLLLLDWVSNGVDGCSDILGFQTAL